MIEKKEYKIFFFSFFFPFAILRSREEEEKKQERKGKMKKNMSLRGLLYYPLLIPVPSSSSAPCSFGEEARKKSFFLRSKEKKKIPKEEKKQGRRRGGKQEKSITTYVLSPKGPFFGKGILGLLCISPPDSIFREDPGVLHPAPPLFSSFGIAAREMNQPEVFSEKPVSLKRLLGYCGKDFPTRSISLSCSFFFLFLLLLLLLAFFEERDTQEKRLRSRRRRKSREEEEGCVAEHKIFPPPFLFLFLLLLLLLAPSEKKQERNLFSCVARRRRRFRRRRRSREKGNFFTLWGEINFRSLEESRPLRIRTIISKNEGTCCGISGATAPGQSLQISGRLEAFLDTGTVPLFRKDCLVPSGCLFRGQGKLFPGAIAPGIPYPDLPGKYCPVTFILFFFVFLFLLQRFRFLLRRRSKTFRHAAQDPTERMSHPMGSKEINVMSFVWDIPFIFSMRHPQPPMKSKILTQRNSLLHIFLRSSNIRIQLANHYFTPNLIKKSGTLYSSLKSSILFLKINIYYRFCQFFYVYIDKFWFDYVKPKYSYPRREPRSFSRVSSIQVFPNRRNNRNVFPSSFVAAKYNIKRVCPFFRFAKILAGEDFSRIS